MTTTQEPTTTVTIEAWNAGGWHRWNVTGTGDQLVAYAERRNAGRDGSDSQYVSLTETEDLQIMPEVGPWTPDLARLQAYLYPQCEHQMSLELCMGPDHFMSADQERAMGW